MDALLNQVRELSDVDQQVFFQRFCEGMTVGQIIPLVKHMEEAWDVEAVQSVPDWAQPPGEEEEVEQTAFDVVVTNCGQKRIAVVKVARVLGNMSLKESSDLLKQLPATILTKAGKDAANAAKSQLEDAGATVEVN